MLLAKLMLAVVGVFPAQTDHYHNNYDIRIQNKQWVDSISAEQVVQRRQVLSNRFKNNKDVKIHFAKTTHPRLSLFSAKKPLLESSQGEALSFERWHEVPSSFLEKFGEDVQLSKPLFLNSSFQYGERAIRRLAQSEASGLVSIWYQQFFPFTPGVSLEIDGAQFRVHFSERGDVYSISNSFVDTLTIHSESLAPKLSPLEVLSIAARTVGISLSTPAHIGNIDLQNSIQFNLQHEQLTQVAEASLVYFPIRSDKLRLAYKVFFQFKENPYLYEILVDALDGRVLVLRNHTHHFAPEPQAGRFNRDDHELYRMPLSFSAYVNEFSLKPLDSPAPMTPGPLDIQRQEEVFRERANFQTLFINEDASWMGWLRPYAELVLGKNIMSFLFDPFSDDTSISILVPNGRDLDYPLFLEDDPMFYRAAAQAQSFYVSNWAHDRFWELGFTEPFGSFQEENFGRGGVAGDPLSVIVGGFYQNNAVFSGYPNDGAGANIQLGDWSFVEPRRSGALDNQLSLHEYGHGVTVRMVGGYEGLQTRGMGEGWSDFFALALLSEESDPIDGNYPVGSYVTKDFRPYNAPDDYNFQENQYFGIRRYPYSTNLSMNPLTYADIDPAQFNVDSNIPTSDLFLYLNPGADAVHNQGEIWCTTLWELRTKFVENYGFEGNDQALQLVVEALKYTPNTANMLEARDAILMADNILFGGLNRCNVWAAFAKRGMGYSAQSPNGDLPSGVVENFDVPNECL